MADDPGYAFETFDVNDFGGDSVGGTGGGNDVGTTDTGSGNTGRTRRKRRSGGTTTEEETLLLLSGESTPKKRRSKKQVVDSGAIAAVLAGGFHLLASTGRPHFEKTAEECTPFAEQLGEYLETWQPSTAVEVMKYMQPIMMLSSLALLVGPPIAVELNNAKLAKQEHRITGNEQNGNKGNNTGTEGLSANIRVSDFEGHQPPSYNPYDRPSFTVPTDD